MPTTQADPRRDPSAQRRWMALLPAVLLACANASTGTALRSGARPSGADARSTPATPPPPRSGSGHHRDPVFGGTYFLADVGPRDAQTPPIVLVHGLGTAAGRDWAPILGTLASRHRVLVIDLPGFGRSHARNELYTPDQYARFLSHIIRTHVGRSVDVVGHSMGAAIALGLAATSPELVRRLVLADVAGILSEEAWVSELVRSPEGSGSNPVDDLSGALLQTFLTTVAPLLPDPELILRTAASRDRWLSGDPSRIAALGLLSTNFEPWLAFVRAPTLLIWGQVDPIAPLRTFEILNHRLPVASTLVLPGVGHNPIAARPGTFATALLNHLDADVIERRPRELGARTPELGPAPPLRCRGQHGLVFTGRFGEVELEDCQNIRFRHATLESLTVRRSTVEMVNVEIRKGLALDHAQARVTISRIEGEPALEMRESTADVAATLLMSVGPAIQVGPDPAHLLGSVSRIHSRGTVGVLHGVEIFQPGDSR